MPLTIWTNLAFDDAKADTLRTRTAPHRLIWSQQSNTSVLVPGGRDPQVVEVANIAWGQPDPLDVVTSKTLKLVCISSAGYTRYDRDDFRDACRSKNIVVANASGVYAESCAQHVLAMMLSVARSLPEALRSQWSDRGWPIARLRALNTVLQPGTRIAVVGYGAIARRLVELLTPFGCEVVAFRRRPTGDENCPTLPVDQLDSELPATDLIINILPLSDGTISFFDQARFARFKPGAQFFNIGRGDTVDQTALEGALRSGRVSAAYLDVTTPEPLPPEHSLWMTPNCYIVPHTAGGSADEFDRQIDHFVDNLRRFERGEPVRDRVI